MLGTLLWILSNLPYIEVSQKEIIYLKNKREEMVLPVPPLCFADQVYAK